MTENAVQTEPSVGWGPFTRLWLANAVSSFGDGVRYTALPLLAVTLTTDPFRLSLVTVAMALPLLFSPIAGVLADSVDRRRLLITVDASRAIVVVALALMVLTHTVNLGVVCVAAALLGLGEAVFMVASQSFLPEVAPAPRLTKANGRLHVAQLIFRDSAGMPAGGVLFVGFAALPFLLDGASFFIGVLLLATIGTRTALPKRDGARPKWSQMVAEGARYLRDDHLLATLAVMLGVANFFVTAMGAVEVLYVVQWLALPASVFGVFLVAGALGGIAGGLSSARIAARAGTFPSALFCLGLAGIAGLVMGLVAQPIVAALCLAVFGFGTAVYQTLTVSFRQASAPPELLGRINGVYRLLGTGVSPLGALAAGALASVAGIQMPYVVAGAGILLLVIVAAGPVLRMASSREDAA